VDDGRLVASLTSRVSMTVFSGMSIEVAWVHVVMMSMSMVKDVTTSNRRWRNERCTASRLASVITDLLKNHAIIGRKYI
jgi:hypothetical protein